MNLLEKLRNLPERKRKIILWSIVIIIGILLFTFYVKSVKLRLKSLSGEEIKEQLKIPELQEELKGLPKIEMPEIKIPEIPEISEEELKKLEEQLKEYEE